MKVANNFDSNTSLPDFTEKRTAKHCPSRRTVPAPHLKCPVASQTLVRGLEVLEAVATGSTDLAALAAALNLTRSTCHRLAGTLVERHYLSFEKGIGYSLGSKLLELGFQARAQITILRVARDEIETLAAATGDTVHLGVLDGMQALYVDKISGRRRVEISSHIGERQPLRSTGLGKALVLDGSEDYWRAVYAYEDREGNAFGVPLKDWVHRMEKYAKAGYALDLEENEEGIRSAAAPIRDISNAIVGAISLSSAAQYMNEKRLCALAWNVRDSAIKISLKMGWQKKG